MLSHPTGIPARLFQSRAKAPASWLTARCQRQKALRSTSSCELVGLARPEVATLAVFFGLKPSLLFPKCHAVCEGPPRHLQVREARSAASPESRRADADLSQPVSQHVWLWCGVAQGMAVSGQEGRAHGREVPRLRIPCWSSGGGSYFYHPGSDGCTIIRFHVFLLEVGEVLEERGAGWARRAASSQF